MNTIPQCVGYGAGTGLWGHIYDGYGDGPASGCSDELMCGHGKGETQDNVISGISSIGCGHGHQKGYGGFEADGHG